MTLGIGRLLDPKSGNELGTVFACESRSALTAFHCVGDRLTGMIRHRKVVCAWDRHKSHASVLDHDRLNDVALLRLDRRLPSDVEPIALTAYTPDHSPFTAPGAPAAVSGVFNFAISGTVVWTRSRLDDGSTVIQLQCNESLAGLPLQGLSGAPVVVGSPPRVAGLIRWNPPRDDNPELATGAAVFAAPSRVILERWPHLDADMSSTERGTLLGTIADRNGRRSSADIGATLKTLLLRADVGLRKDDIEQLPQRDGSGFHTLVINRGHALVQVVDDLRTDGKTEKAERQLNEYITARTKQRFKRCVGVLTDGVEWRLYYSVGENFQPVEGASLSVDHLKPDISRFSAWIETVFATGKSIEPRPREIERRLGAASPSYLLNRAQLETLYKDNRDTAYVRVRRDMWAKLLTTAAGENFDDNDSLFVDHTLLALMAQVIGHAVLNFHPEDQNVSAEDIVSGAEFSRALIGGVVEPDFFDWVVRVPGGKELVKEIARQLTRFAWRNVEHDVMKVLYQSIIPEQVRHALGEYYTPDWLAEEVIAECVRDSLNETVLDASCGSGTFLFHAIRKFVKDARSAGFPPRAIVGNVTERVRGFDVHPVAVTLARVTYLLGIGMDILQDPDRPAFSVPVYLCDSLRWGQRETLWSYQGLSVRTESDHSDLLYDPEYTPDEEFTDKLKFPDSVLEDSDNFDLFVTALAEKVVKSANGRSTSLSGLFRRFSIQAEDQAVLAQTYKNMIHLHQQGRDHIWGYYVRNLARPIWMSRPDNRIDVLVGNPPWLAYRWMTKVQKESFRSMSVERRLWSGSGASVTTSQDLAALFVARCVELYLRPGGRFGYVMPLGTLKLGQYRGFRRGHYPVQTENVKVRFGRPWDLHRIKPSFFSQSVGVVFGERTKSLDAARELDDVAEVWTGRFATKTAGRAEAAFAISRAIGEPPPITKPSVYLDRFFEGASVVPQVLFLVDRAEDAGPLGTGARRRRVRSQPSQHRPWKDVEPIRRSVEARFIHRLYLGRSILPYRCLDPEQAVIPWDGQTLLHPEEIEAFPGLASWWEDADRAWTAHRSNPRLELRSQLDYRRKLSVQLPPPAFRVVSPKSAMYPAAAVVTDNTAFVDQQLFWGGVGTHQEARYLTAVLNSTTIQLAVQPLQPRGEHNPRDLCRYAFQLPVPQYDPDDDSHSRLVELAERAEAVAANTNLPSVRFEAQRRHIREALVEDGVSADIDAVVKTLLE